MTSLRPFHQASWNEPIILELSSPGERGIIRAAGRAGDRSGSRRRSLGDSGRACAARPRPRCRSSRQPQVLRHYLRLSQETLGDGVNVHLGLGTCTMKYSPRSTRS